MFEGAREKWEEGAELGGMLLGCEEGGYGGACGVCERVCVGWESAG